MTASLILPSEGVPFSTSSPVSASAARPEPVEVEILNVRLAFTFSGCSILLFSTISSFVHATKAAQANIPNNKPLIFIILSFSVYKFFIFVISILVH